MVRKVDIHTDVFPIKDVGTSLFLFCAVCVARDKEDFLCSRVAPHKPRRDLHRIRNPRLAKGSLRAASFEREKKKPTLKGNRHLYFGSVTFNVIDQNWWVKPLTSNLLHQLTTSNVNGVKQRGCN